MVAIADRNSRHVCLLTVIIALSLLLIGCGKISQSNYDKIKIGMPRSEVESILGPGEKATNAADPSDKHEVVIYGGFEVGITYDNNRVIQKGWITKGH
jgi:hypothetical protein